MKKYYEGKDIYKPIFIVGPERSGTTLLYSLLSNAKEVYWLSRIDSIFPSAPMVAHVLRSIFSTIERGSFAANYKEISSMTGVNTPSECMPYWEKIFNFGYDGAYKIRNDLFTTEDVTVTHRTFINNDFKKRLYLSNKDRLLFKQPGFSLKLLFWNTLFEDALFLICVRSISGNIRSYEKAKGQSDEQFWGTKVPGWRDYRSESSELQAAYQLIKIYEYMADILADPVFKERFLVVPYEHVIQSPRKVLEDVMSFSGLEWNSKIEKSLKAVVQREQETLSKEPLNSDLEILHYLKKEAEKILSEQ